MDLDGRHLLVIRLSALGDVIRTLPAVHPLMNAFPNARFTWLVDDKSASLLRRVPRLNLLEVKRTELKSGSPIRALREWGCIIREIRQADVDVSIDFHGVAKSAFLPRWAGVKHRIGYERGGSKEGSRWLINDRFSVSAKKISRYQRSLELAEYVAGRQLELSMPEFELSEDERHRVAGIASDRPLVLFPGTSHWGRYKRWPATYWARLYRHFADRHAVFAFGPEDQALRQELTDILGAGLRSLPPLNLTELAELLRRSRGIVACDTGPMHLASVMGTKVLALMGPSNSDFARPIDTRWMFVPPAPCAPCRRRDCRLLICQTLTPPRRIIELTENMLGTDG